MLRHVGEIVFKIAITAGVLVAIAYQFALVIGIWNQRVDPVQTLRNVITRQLKPEWVAIRESTRIYQSRQPVGIVIGEVTRSDNQVIFEWMVDVASFNQSEPFEYQGERLRIVSVSKSTLLDMTISPPTSSLKQVVCERLP